MGPEIAEQQDLWQWLYQEFPKHSLLNEFELIVPRSIVSVQSLHRHNEMSLSLLTRDTKMEWEGTPHLTPIIPHNRYQAA